MLNPLKNNDGGLPRESEMTGLLKAVRENAQNLGVWVQILALILFLCMTLDELLNHLCEIVIMVL